jgi:hypothetical protein
MQMDTDIWVLKTNKDFNIEWNATFGGDSEEYVSDVIQSSDDGYVILGETKSYAATEGGSDLWAIKIDADGNVPPTP